MDNRHVGDAAPAQSRTIFFSVGEPSGDLHGANLIRALQELRPDLEFVGYGGPQMQAAGCKLHFELTALAVMWIVRVLLNIHVFWRLYRQAGRYFETHRPAALVLVDYPGFNWWMARAAKRRGIPVFYCSPPQIWAWASWRVHKMRRFVDHVLCGLPFEESWLRERGVNATFTGHPYFDEVRRQTLDERFLADQRSRPGPLVTILPGSRTQEVTHNLPWFLKAAALVRREFPNVRFAVASFKPQQAELAKRLISAGELPVEVHVGRTPELIELATCTMACSGSVSLELLHRCKPTVILYWVDRASFFVQQYFRKVKYITLVNLLSTGELYPKDMSPYDPNQADADRVLFPEYLTCEDKSSALAAHVAEWLRDRPRREALEAKLRGLREQVGHGGASRKAAEYILKTLAPLSGVLQPHFAPSPKRQSVR